MGSFLNFVFLPKKFTKNGGDDFIEGPLFNYIRNKKLFSITLNGNVKDGYKNILLLEPSQTLSGIAVRGIPDDILEFCKINSVKILVASLADPSTIQSYNEAYDRYRKEIDSNQIYLMDSNTALKDIYSFDYFLEESLECKNTFFDNGINNLGYASKEIKEAELNSFRRYKFLSFNRNTGKPHRLSLLHEYLTKDYSDSLFSFLIPPNYAPESVGIFFRHIDFYKSSLPIELDTHSAEDIESFRTSDTFKKELFLNSCINLVTETSFSENELFISEKILKPILNYQPFIVFGPFGYLKRLKEYGFKTFSDFWDESYDNIENQKDRLHAVLDVVRDINSKSIEEVNELYQKTKRISIYNRNLFHTLKLPDSIYNNLKEIENEW